LFSYFPLFFEAVFTSLPCFGLLWVSVEILKLASLNTNVWGDVRGERSSLRAYHWYPNNEIKYGCLRANQCCVKKTEKTTFASVAKIKIKLTFELITPWIKLAPAKMVCSGQAVHGMFLP